MGGGHKKGLDINSRARLGGAFLPYDPPGSGAGAEEGEPKKWTKIKGRRKKEDREESEG